MHHLGPSKPRFALHTGDLVSYSTAYWNELLASSSDESTQSGARFAIYGGTLQGTGGIITAVVVETTARQTQRTQPGTSKIGGT